MKVDVWLDDFVRVHGVHGDYQLEIWGNVKDKKTNKTKKARKNVTYHPTLYHCLLRSRDWMGRDAENVEELIELLECQLTKLNSFAKKIYEVTKDRDGKNKYTPKFK